MGFQKRALQALRQALLNFDTDESWQSNLNLSQIKNQWFNQAQLKNALNQWVNALTDNQIDKWIDQYEWPIEVHQKKLGIIMAGNIPLVGMHDVIVGVLTGFKVIAKLSSDDEVLPKFWIQKAAEFDSIWDTQVTFTDQLKGVDAAIATGSNNSARYFEYYFKNIPHLLRRNRNSVAVLTGNETEQELKAFGHDVFDYYGLGCRNVTKVYLPENYQFKTLFDVWEKYHAEVAFHNKYVNNYNYHKALLLMNLDPHIDAGYILLKERKELYSPVGMLNYEYYNSIEEVKNEIEQMADEIQCVVSQHPEISNIPLGQSQCPTLYDYADGIDTVKWAIHAIH